MRKALFLDRDGVVNKMVKKYSKSYKKMINDSPFRVSELKFNEGIKEIIELARKKKYLPIIITNQPSIVKGEMTMKNYELLTTKICNFLDLKRSQIFECFHKEGFTAECECRKPKPGLFFMAKGMFDLNLKKSIMIGDSHTDIIAAVNAGIKKTIYVRREGNEEDGMKMHNFGIYPSETINNLNEIISKRLI